jgi:CheY-like chemotaxis protein
MSKSKNSSGRSGSSEGPIKVLLAEDEESFIDALVIGLTNEGFRITVARDGAEALRLFDETDPDILLLDMMLPKLSGIDVCRAIRTRSRVPIIMVTAKGTEIDTVVALETSARAGGPHASRPASDTRRRDDRLQRHGRSGRRRRVGVE